MWVKVYRGRRLNRRDRNMDLGRKGKEVKSLKRRGYEEGKEKRDERRKGLEEKWSRQRRANEER